MEINRRDFLKLLGGSLGGAAAFGALEGPIFKIVDSKASLLYSGPRVETWKMTACTRCPGGCSLKVRLIDDFPIQTFGNDLSPVNQGGICSMGLTAVESLYHPQRLTSPMKKVDGKFKPISYDEALAILTDGVKKIISQRKGENFFFSVQSESQARIAFFAQLMKKTGGKLAVDSFSKNCRLPYFDWAEEAPDYLDFSCDLILNFASEMTEVSEAPVYFARKLHEFKSSGKRIVALSPKLTPSAMFATDWVPTMPSYKVLALGILYVVIESDLYDKEAVARRFVDTHVLDTIIAGVRRDYTPNKVAALTRIPANKIIEIGRTFGLAKKPVAYFDEVVLHSSDGAAAAQAIMLLNAFKGFQGMGKFVAPPFVELRKLTLKAELVKNQGELMSRLLDKKPVDMLMILNSNFLFNASNQDVLSKALDSVPFVVSLSSFIDETTSHAHLIIPDHHEMERSDVVIHDINFPLFNLQQPIVKPFYATSDAANTVNASVKKLGLDAPHTDYEAYINEILTDIYQRGTGIIMTEPRATAVEEAFGRTGWQLVPYANFNEFREKLAEKGGWWDPFAKRVPYKTVIAPKSMDRIFGPSEARLPEGRKLLLNVFRKGFDYKGNMGVSPVLNEQFGAAGDISVFYELWAEINPATARQLGISDNSKISIITPKGHLSAIAKYNPAVMLHNIDVPFGLGHKNFGDTFGENPLVFTDDRPDPVTGKAAFSQTLVEVKIA